MRLIFGMIIGASLTVGAAYIADVVGGADAKPLVNWEVVGKNIDAVTRSRVQAGRGLPADSSGFVHQTSILPR
jgi:hypothetical protein